MSTVTPKAQASIEEDRRRLAQQVRAAGSSFYWAMRLMSAERRAALFAIYAFCRDVDDIADGPLLGTEKIAALKDWRQHIDGLYDGKAGDDPLDRQLLAAIGGFGLLKDDFTAVIRGMEMDAEGPIRAPSYDQLIDYCDCVASAVGRLCVRVFGAPEAEGRRLSDHLGKALQLTNIIRDVEEDADMGRLYLPRDLLIEAGIHDTDPQTVAHAPGLPLARQALAKQAEAEFNAARQALKACHEGDLRPAAIMMHVYHQIFLRMRDKGFKAPHRSGFGPLMSKGEKLWIAAKIALGGRSWRIST
ncbi:squalene synthase HpnD [Iodidimonas nitroreducens]|uniref:Squalene synthase HpnD n=1 Tax=Iodidimonas nitroreducens TaxID=1236968 RepID=A0A5A7NC74_9PROT|nr:presqualene diphosphate synthase HpnD [Iodidimonas nitroreducens]GAK33988.1 putative phytoene synthase [alpha proteobacterium Q-1]GER05527.1 squalene synthase HpnD [Iodidimonas nitroreducens]